MVRYEAWLAGEDYGCHPEDPHGKPTPAPRPTIEEFLNNKDNAGKLIPQCMLEPTKKQRRHPIHKKKSEGNGGGLCLFEHCASLDHDFSVTSFLPVDDIECRIKEEDSETEDIKDIADVDAMQSKVWFKDQNQADNT